MNERIKELAGKALDQTMPETWYVISPDDLDRITAKLAELIVLECVEVCEKGFQGEFTSAGIHQCVTDLKKHFGVEE
jgi:hypothetical protein